ncbi:MAG: DUF167 domain-containing protein [Planctomycetota bacterium]
MTCSLAVIVHPGARRESIGPRRERGLKVSVHAPPEKGKANRAALDLLARWLGLPRRNLTILHGETARRKVIRIEGLEPSALEEKLKTLADA